MTVGTKAANRLPVTNSMLGCFEIRLNILNCPLRETYLELSITASQSTAASLQQYIFTTGTGFGFLFTGVGK